MKYLPSLVYQPMIYCMFCRTIFFLMHNIVPILIINSLI